METSQFTVEDMIIAVAKNKDFDDISCRVFLYLIGKLMQQEGIVQKIILSPTDAAVEIGISEQKYKKAISFILNYRLIERQFLENGKEELYINPDETQWQLNQISSIEEKKIFNKKATSEQPNELFTVEIIDDIVHVEFLNEINDATAWVILNAFDLPILVEIPCKKDILTLVKTSKILEKPIEFGKKTIDYIKQENLHLDPDVKQILDEANDETKEDKIFRTYFKKSILSEVLT